MKLIAMHSAESFSGRIETGTIDSDSGRWRDYGGNDGHFVGEREVPR